MVFSLPALWVILAALANWLGFANDFFHFPPLILLWPVCLAEIGLNVKNKKRAFILGWLASFLGSSGALYWLCLPVAQVGNLPWPLAIFCSLFIAACIALQGGCFCLLANLLERFSVLRLCLCLSFAWYLLEYAFAVAFGFPWLAISSGLAAWPVLIQSADLVGAYFSSSLWLLAAFLIIFAFKTAYFKIAISSGLLIAIALLTYGNLKLAQENLGDNGDLLKAIFIEGNIDQNQKWEPAFQQWTLNHYIDLTAQSLSAAQKQGWTAPLVIWPETALPFFFERTPYLARQLIAAVQGFNCPLLFGAPGVDHKPDALEDAVYNRAFLLGPNGVLLSQYDKVHLVPFGEYLPSWLNFDFLSALTQGVGIYQAGEDPAPLRYGRLALGMLICYESIFPWLAYDRVRSGANILVDISNDGWFGLTPAARQHLYLTTPRCVEQNRWLLRATNNGISAVVDNHGRVGLQGNQFQTGFILAQAKLESNKTIFFQIAPLLPFFILSCLLILIITAKKYN